MPLASGSAKPYRKPKINAPGGGDEEALSQFAKVRVGDTLTTQLSSVSAHDSKAEAEAEAAREAAARERDAKQAAEDKAALDAAAHAAKDAADAGKAKEAASLQDKSVVIPLYERPNDQRRIRRLISGTPLVAVSAVFAAFSL